MNSMKETILMRWNELSSVAKALLRNKNTLKLDNAPQALELLSQISLLTSQSLLKKSLIMTYHVSDAIFIQMVLAQANPNLSLNLILSHQKNLQHSFDEADITIMPFSCFSYVQARKTALDLSNINSITLDQAIPTEFLYDLFFIDEANQSLLVPENETSLLTTDFTTLSRAITASLPKEKITDKPLAAKVPKPIREKISLSSKTAPESIQEIKEVKEKPAAKIAAVDEVNTAKTEPQRTPKKAKKDTEHRQTLSLEVETETVTTPTESPVTSNEVSSDPSTDKALVAPTAFIGVVPRNLQRQYIRDYIREHGLQHTLVVTHNRQSARLLEKYLYRARIRSRVVHEKIDDETATSLFDRYNSGQFTVLILMHRVVEDLSAKIEKCDSVIFLDFPTVYSEYAERLRFVRENFNPAHFISIANDNDKVWLQALLEEYPDLNLPITEIEITPPKRKNVKPAQETPKKTEAIVTEESASQSQATPESDTPDEAAAKPRERRDTRKTRAPRQERTERPERSDRRERNPRANNNPRRRQDTHHASTPEPGNYEAGDSQSDFFSNNQDEIVNRNRLPFESGSFEANIARENRRRGRDSFNTPGGVGQSTSGNFIQNITQGMGPNHNPNSKGDSQSQNRRNNNRNRPNPKNSRKK